MQIKLHKPLAQASEYYDSTQDDAPNVVEGWTSSHIFQFVIAPVCVANDVPILNITKQTLCHNMYMAANPQQTTKKICTTTLDIEQGNLTELSKLNQA